MISVTWTRRQLLTFAGLSVGVGAIGVVARPGAAAAASSTRLALEPVSDRTVPVLSGDSTAPGACPRQLAVRVVRDGLTLPAGTTVAVAFDPRLFAPVAPAAVSLDGRPIAARSTTSPDPATGQNSCVVTIDRNVPAEGELIVVVGTAHPLPYPRDLVRGPAGAAADVTAKVAPRSHLDLRPTRPAVYGGPSTPWGVEMFAAWGRQTWGTEQEFHYYHPVRITIRGVGPGRATQAAAFAVSVDPQLVGDIQVTSVQLNRRHHADAAHPAGQTRTASMYQSRWRTSIRLAPGDVLDIALRITPLTPPSALATITHPVVSAWAMGTDIAQRQTGRTSLSRQDSIWQ